MYVLCVQESGCTISTKNKINPYSWNFFILLYTVHRPNPHLDSTFVGFLPIVSSLVFSSLLACLESIVSSSLF